MISEAVPRRSARLGSGQGEDEAAPIYSHRDGLPQTQNHADRTSSPLSAAGRDGTRGSRKPYGGRDKGPHARCPRGAATHRPVEPGPRRPRRARAQLAAPSPGCPFRRRAAPAAPRGSPGGFPRPAPARCRPPPARSEPWPPPTAPGGVTRTRGGRGHASGGRGRGDGGRGHADGAVRGEAGGRCAGAGVAAVRSVLDASCRREAFLTQGLKQLREELGCGAAGPQPESSPCRSRLARPL